MTRERRIIVSLVGIFIVVLALIGVTFGYWMTRVVYNTEEKSLSVKLGTLELKYGDGNGILAPKEAIMPGEEVGTKTFTVENTGDNKSLYGVIFENVNNPLERKTDLVYTITCESTKGTCNALEGEQIFPSTNITILNNEIASKEKHTYTIKVTYKNPDANQSADMGKTFSAKVNILNGSEWGEIDNTYQEGTLAYNVLHRADQRQKDFDFTGDRTVYMPVPVRGPAREKTTASEKELSVTQDKYGKSYYFRGNPTDNYLTFNNMCWRIVRVQGDGSIKIVLQDKSGPCSLSTKNNENAFSDTDVYYGYSYESSTYIADYVNCASSKSSCLRTKLQNWFNKNFTTSNSSQTEPSNDKPTLKDEYEGKIKYEEWEIGDWTTKYDYDKKYGSLASDSATNWAYEPYLRIVSTSKENRYATLMPSESETNVTVNDYVATLTADEVALAGALAHDVVTYRLSYFLDISADYSWWTLSAGRGHSSTDRAFCVNKTYSEVWDNYAVHDDYRFAARPAVVLESSVLVSGEGTLNNPYIVQ